MADLTSQAQLQSAQIASQSEKPSVVQTMRKAIGNLTMREKALIWAFIIVAVTLALVFFLILPAHDALTTAQNERQALQSEQTTTQLTIAAIPTTKTQLKVSEEQYTESLALYQAPLLPEDIDYMLTALIEGCGFTASSLTLTPSTTEEISKFIAVAPSWEILNPETTEKTTNSGSDGSNAENESLNAAVTTGTEETTSNSDTFDYSDHNNASSAAENSVTIDTTASTETTASTSNGSAQAQVYTVQMTAIGHDDDFYALLDKILPLSWIKLVSTTYTPSSLTSTDYAATEQSCSLTFKIYVHAEGTVKSF